MKPAIDGTEFGNITIAGERYEHDVMIRRSGMVEKLKKQLSTDKYGTSHIVSPDEARYIFEQGAKHLIIGTWQNDQLELSKEASAYLQQKGCAVQLLVTPQAMLAWNQANGELIGMFHVTC